MNISNIDDDRDVLRKTLYEYNDNFKFFAENSRAMYIHLRPQSHALQLSRWPKDNVEVLFYLDY